MNNSIELNALATNNTGLPPIQKAKITISIRNNGFVKFGTFSTKDLQFTGEFRIGKSDTLVASPAEGFVFDQWQIKIQDSGEFVFVSDDPTTSFTPTALFDGLEIRAVFLEED